MRLSEVHPALVHFPIALLPVAVGADALGRLNDSRELHAVGRVGIVLAAASAALAGVFGFIAQEAVDIDDEAQPILQTHRTLNVAALGVVTAMAIARASRKRPTTGYLLTGVAAIAVVSFSAYLGGKLVYSHGLGVEKARGIYASDPTILPRPERRAASTAVKDLAKGVAHAAQDVAHGELLPALGRRARPSRRRVP
jgi:uncharacterized membrane protein